MATLQETWLAHIIGTAAGYSTRHVGLMYGPFASAEATYSGYARLPVSSWIRAAVTWQAQGGPWTFAATTIAGQYTAALFEGLTGGGPVILTTGASSSLSLIVGQAFRLDSFSLDLSWAAATYGDISDEILHLVGDSWFGIASYGSFTPYLDNASGGPQVMPFTRVGNVATSDSAVAMDAGETGYALTSGTGGTPPGITVFPGDNTAGGPVAGGIPAWTGATIPAGRLRLRID